VLRGREAMIWVFFGGQGQIRLELIGGILNYLHGH
jgi:hypothetical protein